MRYGRGGLFCRDGRLSIYCSADSASAAITFQICHRRWQPTVNNLSDSSSISLCCFADSALTFCCWTYCLNHFPASEPCGPCCHDWWGAVDRSYSIGCRWWKLARYEVKGQPQDDFCGGSVALDFHDILNQNVGKHALTTEGTFRKILKKLPFGHWATGNSGMAKD